MARKKRQDKEHETPEAGDGPAETTDSNAPDPTEAQTSKVQIVNQELVKEAVQFINEKANETLYKGSEEIGAYLLEKFFNNDFDTRRP